MSKKENSFIKKLLLLIVCSCILHTINVNAYVHTSTVEVYMRESITSLYKNGTCSILGDNILLIEIPILEINYKITVDTDEEITMDFLNSVSYTSFDSVQEGWDKVADLLVDLNETYCNKMKKYGIADPTSVLMLVDHCGDGRYDDIYICIVNSEVIIMEKDVRKIVYVICNQSELKETEMGDKNTINKLSSENAALKHDIKSLKSEQESSVSKNDYDTIIAERDSLISENTKLEEEIKTLKENNVDTSGQKIELEDMSVKELKALRSNINEILGDSGETVSNSKLEYGTLTGSITYFFNDYKGHVADTNSTVILIPMDAENIDINTEKLIDMDMQSDFSFGEGVYSAAVNGMGTYTINHVPAGEYLIWIASGNTNTGAWFDAYDSENEEAVVPYYKSVASKASGLITEDDAYAIAKAIGPNQSHYDKVTVYGGESIVFDYDFGYTYF